MMTRFNNDFGWHIAHFVSACFVIFVGLLLRGYGYDIGLPFIIVKYGGSILWGSMVYLLIAAVMPRNFHRFAMPIACAVAIIVEMIRLIHFPVLDEFRATVAGALLLGRVFSIWNIGCYLVGIGFAAVIAAFVERRFGRH